MALTQPSLIPQPWGSNGQVGNIPQDSSEFGKASWAKGFPSETAQPLTEGGIPPNYLDFQGVLNALSAHAVFQQSGAHYAWSNTLDYPVGCFVLGSDGKLYQALQASGPGYSAGAKNPTTSAAYWSVVPLASEIVALEQKDAAQDAAISAALISAVIEDGELVLTYGDGRITREALPNGLPIGALMPYTGKDVPAGFLRADGTTYTNMQASFPKFYEWVVNSGLTVPLADYTLVEGSCGYYGLDTSTGTVRMPTLAAGVFGTTAAGQYGQAVQAGLPNITGYTGGALIRNGAYDSASVGAFFYADSYDAEVQGAADGYWASVLQFDASRSSPIYGRSDTVTPSHVKYPWVIVVYNAAVPPSVAQAGEFIEMLDKLATALPTGTVVPHAGNKDLNGYLLCNGAAVSRTTYAKLYEAIGTTYGAGDGSTTFNLPNLTDKFIQGSGTAGTVKAAGLPEIAAWWCGPYEYDSGVSGDSWGNGAVQTAQDTYNYMEIPGEAGGGKMNYRFNASRSNGTYGASNTVQPPAVTMRYYIKY